MAAPKVRIVSDWNPSGVKAAQRDLGVMEQQAQGFSSAISKSFMGIGAAIGGIFAATAVIDFFKESAQAAMEDEKSMVALSKAMDNVGLAAQNAKAEGLIESMMLQTGIADDQLRPAYQKLVTVTKDVGEAQGLLQTALDLSAAGYGNLESATKALSAAANGNFTALQRLKVPIDQNIIASKDFDAAVQALNRTVGGQAAAATQTYAGQMARLSVAAGEAKEAIGYALLDAVDALVNKLGGVGGLQKTILKTGDDIALLIRGLTNLGDRLYSVIEPLDTLLNLSGGFGGPEGKSLIDWVKQALSNFGPLGRTVATLITALQVLGLTSEDTAASQGQMAATARMAGLAGHYAKYGLADMSAGMDDLADSSANAAEQILKTVMAANAMALSREHNARAEMAGKGPSLDLLRVLLPMREAMDKVGGAGGGAASGVDKLTKAQEAAQQRAQKLAQDVDGLATSLQGLATDVAGGPVIDLLNPTFEAINSLVEKFKSSLSEARNYAQGIVDGFMGQLDIGKALDDAKASGGSIVEAFVKQGDKVIEFGRKMNALLKQGLSKAAFDDIMKLGYERGTEVANALSDGNVAGNIASVNKVYSSVKTMAEEIADAAAKAFYDAGLKVMESMIRAMIEGLGIGGKQRKRLMDIMDSLAASMNRTASIYVGITGPGAGMAGGTVSTSEWFAATYPGVAAAPGDASFGGQDFSNIDLSGIGGLTGSFMFADGGIATSPTPGIFGEAGPEALIPLDRMSDFGGNTYQITVQAGVGDPRAIGKSVVEAITLFERSSGPVFARA